LSWVPEQGTVGASGDLAPLSHLALGLMGEGQMWSPETGWGDAKYVSYFCNPEAYFTTKMFILEIQVLKIILKQNYLKRYCHCVLNVPNIKSTLNFRFWRATT
jgi:hypothetical protein